MGICNKVFRKAMGMIYVKRANWNSSELKRLKDRTLWRYRPLQKGKRDYR
jgi:hypothetical protein